MSTGLLGKKQIIYNNQDCIMWKSLFLIEMGGMTEILCYGISNSISRLLYLSSYSYLHSKGSPKML